MVGGLRLALMATDLAALVVGWCVAVASMPAPGWEAVTSPSSAWLLALFYGGAAGVALRTQRLYQARVARSWSLEVTGLVRTAAVAAGVVLLAHPGGGSSLRIFSAVLFATAATALVVGRLAYRAVLRGARRRGHFVTAVVVVGHGDHAADVVGALADDPASGFRVAGVAGPAWNDAGVDYPHIGHTTLDASAVREVGATGAIIDPEGLPPGHVDRVVHDLVAAGLHVQVSTGVRRLHARRLTPSNLSYQALLYVEPPTLSRMQCVLKRALDVVGATLGLAVTAPVLAVSAAAIKLEDGGPVFFRQHRVGRGGRPFEVLKLRSMVVDAEERRAQLEALNERDGPLFKLERDPRVTRVGHMLRATSIDEIPQFVNVLRGDMSLVGPRPALPQEVAAFDESLATRGEVRPGITGLWQVEARDHESFDAYRRLDLFYVHNWSLGFDLTLLAVTPLVVAARAIAPFASLGKPAWKTRKPTTDQPTGTP